MTPASSPVPQGNYAPAKRFGGLVFVSGMTPRENGVLTAIGKIAEGKPVERYRPAVELATRNALLAAQSVLASGEVLTEAVSLTVYLNTTPEFTAHSRIADFASAVLAEVLGSIPSRAAVGVSSLPGGASVEISLVAGISPSD
ncbi:endoribonuclease L-PSP [Devosia sp. 17-2-E-8]|nr:endoribonuclease L-PSP [Devosia sp. 17-2-E-8]